jgi:eukaryotic-like serine/threonine-protein kinase
MSFVAGTKLGPFEILAPLGAGGMGEVYRARDTRLGRDVAIKVLPESFANDAERLRRFEQEARAIATLNHPNILSVHDIGEQESTHYLVAELLEGETLREKLSGGALPQRKAIEYALQIAAGLGAAHQKGVVHRDLKPENLFVTRDGRVKILDFGLAKTDTAALAAGVAPDGTTLDASLPARTAAGMVLGTVGYMSPEQVRGVPADSRSDIFSFGTVLYEALSGRRAFRGDSSVETMSAILKADVPEISGATTPVSPAVDRIVRRCLEKEPEQRFQSAKDLAFALEAVSGSTQTSPAPRVVAAQTRKWLPLAGALGLLVVAGAAYLAGTRHGAEPATLQRLTFQRGYVSGARFLPDGQNVVYSAMWDGHPYEVYSIRPGDYAARPLGFKNAVVVGVAANGDLALLTNVRHIRTTSWMQVGTLARAPAGGGAARELLEDVWDADISRDGQQFAVVRTTNGPHQLEYPIGRVLFTTNGYITAPRISPDGKSVAFMEHPVFADNRGYVDIADASGKVRRLTPEASGEQGLAWSPDGHEVWYDAASSGIGEREVFAISLTGKVRKVMQIPSNAVVDDIGPDGRLLFSSDTQTGEQMVVSPADAPPRNVSTMGYGIYGELSADGKSIAFTESGPGTPLDYLIFYRKLDEPAAVNIGEGDSVGLTPDGKYVVAEVPSQPTKIRILPTGAGEVRTFDVTPVQVDRTFISWLPGAKEFSFLGHEGTNAPHAYRVALTGGPARPLTKQPGAHFWNRISPDGKYVLQGPGVALMGAASNWGNIKMELLDLHSGETRPAALEPEDEPIDWAQDSRHVFVARETAEGATLFKVDVFSGQREVWKQVRPADPAGMLRLSLFSVNPSGNAYAYSTTRVLSALYIRTQ